MRTLRFILHNLDQFRALFWVNIFAAFLDGLVVFLIPVLLSEFTKTDLSLDSFNKLVPYLVVCFAGSLVLQWILRRWGEALAKQFGNYLRLKYFKVIERLRVDVLLNHHSGYILSLVTKVCDGVTEVVFTMIWLAAHSFATLCLFFIFTAKESVFIAILNLVVLVIFLVISILFSRKMVPIAEKLNILHATLIERFVDLMTNISTVKKLGVYEFSENQLRYQVDTNYDQIQRLQNFHANRWFVLHAIYGVAFLSTIVFLLYQISSGEISASILILFISAFAVIRGHIERLSELIKDLLEMDAYVRTLKKITRGIETDNQQDFSQEWNDIELISITFSYEDSDKTVKVPRFNLRKGDCVCIAGESGQGKSTFINILAYFLEPQSGTLLLDGLNYSDQPRDKFRSLMSIVSQEVELFNISVRDNISLGQNLSDEQIHAVLDGLKLREWYEQLPEGLDTLVGEKGVKLSAGQKQRINIARGVLLDRPVILFDEPTSHLDLETEKHVINFLSTHLHEKSAVFISHRPAVEALCNRKYRFENSTLVLQQKSSDTCGALLRAAPKARKRFPKG